MSFEVDLDSAVPEEDYVASSTASKPQGSSGLHPKAKKSLLVLTLIAQFQTRKRIKAFLEH